MDGRIFLQAAGALRRGKVKYYLRMAADHGDKAREQDLYIAEHNRNGNFVIHFRLAKEYNR